MDPTTLVLVAAIMWSALAAFVVVLCLAVMVYALVLLLRHERARVVDPLPVQDQPVRYRDVVHPADYPATRPPEPLRQPKLSPQHVAASRFGGGLGATRRDLSDQQAAAFAGDPEGAWVDVADEPLVRGEN